MTTSEQLREVAQTRAPFSTWVGVVVLFAIFGVIVLAIIGPSPRSDDYEQKRAKAREEKLKTLRDENAKALTTYGWIDKAKGTVRVPIEQAMQLTIADLAQKQPAAAGPIATPAPQASAAPAPTARLRQSQLRRRLPRRRQPGPRQRPRSRARNRKRTDNPPLRSINLWRLHNHQRRHHRHRFPAQTP